MKLRFIVFLISWTILVSTTWYVYSLIVVDKAKAAVIQELAKNGETTGKVCLAWWFGKPELSVKHKQHACR